MKAGILIYSFLYFTLATTLSNCIYKPANSTDTGTITSLQQLLEGNKRFAAQKSLHPHKSGKRIKELADAQNPSIAVICCSDSRVPPEIIFDQGLGDMFVVRTAGNLMGDLELGSLEYAVEHLGVKQIVVMGHKECGAIKAYLRGGKVPGHIKHIVQCIKQEEEIKRIPVNDKNLLDDCIRANIFHGMHQLFNQSALIAERVSRNKLVIEGVCYDLQKGLVEVVRE